ncbi:hypothetical protein Leryth_008599 [Lithospermum erythrorhizon]|nr:hypothetical protein Leryth_008599 [Lithospermum erythrorhizon]
MKKMKSEASSSGGGGGGGGGESVVADAGRRKSSCGYCKSTARSSISHGLWARSLTVHDYQALLDRGWRRSGSFLYKPDMERTCCPSYTIRLKACDFSPSKEQRRVLNRIQSISAYNSSSIISMRLSSLLLVVMDVSKKNCWKSLLSTLDEKDSSQLMDYSDPPRQSGCPSSNDGKMRASIGTIFKHEKFEIRTKKSSYDPEEYSLYRKYQIRVHNDTPEHVSEFSYMRFLVDTPLVFVPPTGDGTVPPCGFGSFHQQYLIDGKLVAVGGKISFPIVYLFWDPDLAFLSLGKFSALRELKWNLGYFRSMWISFDIARPLLDQNKYVVLSDFSTSHDGQSIMSNVGKCVEQQNDDTFQEGPNYPFVGEDAKMVPSSDESEEDESDSETPESTFIEVKDGDLDNILIGLKASRLNRDLVCLKDLRHAIGSSDRKYLDAQVLRYKKVVGPELSERMVYTLG